MATLVQFLASGVNGAALGTATFVLRGTASSAASVLWTDFEATAQPGTNIITLDANGAAEIYTDAYVDCTLKTSGGATLRTITVGNSATTVEVISDSFTGTDYSGSPSGVNEPITLAAVLNKWDNSAGADDWKVLVGGVATNLSSAMASFSGLFFSVKDPAFGGVGDGVTDDTTAIGLAITAASAAGGGIVFFPATTSFYKFTNLTITAANVTLMGTGPKSSILKSAAASGTAISFSDTTAGSWKKIISLGLQGTGANNDAFLGIDAAPNFLIENVEIVTSTYTGTCVARTTTATTSNIVIKDSVISIGVDNSSAITNLCASDNVAYINLTNTKFIAPAGFDGNVLIGPNFSAIGCTFDCSAVTSGVYRHVNATSNATAGKYLGHFSNNRFIDGGSTGFAFQLVGIASASNFYETSNVFIGFTAPTAITSAGQIYNVSHSAADSYNVWLGSRLGRTIEITHASTGTVVISALASYQNLFINYTGAGNLVIQPPVSVMTSGAEGNVVLQNNDASQRDITIDYGETPQSYGPQAATSGSDLVLQPGAAERCVFTMKFIHLGGGSPLAFTPVPVED